MLEIGGHADHVHLLVEVDPQFGIHASSSDQRAIVAACLRREFRGLRSRLADPLDEQLFRQHRGRLAPGGRQAIHREPEASLTVATHRKVYRFRMRRPGPGAGPEPDGRCTAMGLELGLAPVEGRIRGHGKTITLKQLSAELTALKQQPETAWLNEAD